MAQMHPTESLGVDGQIFFEGAPRFFDVYCRPQPNDTKVPAATPLELWRHPISEPDRRVEAGDVLLIHALEAERQKVATLEVQLLDAQRVQSQWRDAMQEVTLVQQRLRSLESEANDHGEQLARRCDELEKEKIGFQCENSDLQVKVAELQREKMELEAMFTAKITLLDRRNSELQDHLQDLCAQVDSLRHGNSANHESETAAARQQVQEYAVRLAAVEQEKLLLASRVDELARRADALQTALTESKLSEPQVLLQAAQQQVADLQSKNSALQAEIVVQQQHWEQVVTASRLETTNLRRELQLTRVEMGSQADRDLAKILHEIQKGDGNSPDTATGTHGKPGPSREQQLVQQVTDLKAQLEGKDHMFVSMWNGVKELMANLERQLRQDAEQREEERLSWQQRIFVLEQQLNIVNPGLGKQSNQPHAQEDWSRIAMASSSAASFPEETNSGALADSIVHEAEKTLQRMQELLAVTQTGRPASSQLPLVSGDAAWPSPDAVRTALENVAREPTQAPLPNTPEQLRAELQQAHELLAVVQRKYKTVKGKYVRQALRQNELQQALLHQNPPNSLASDTVSSVSNSTTQRVQTYLGSDVPNGSDKGDLPRSLTITPEVANLPVTAEPTFPSSGSRKVNIVAPGPSSPVPLSTEPFPSQVPLSPATYAEQLEVAKQLLGHHFAQRGVSAEHVATAVHDIFEGYADGGRLSRNLPQSGEKHRPRRRSRGSKSRESAKGHHAHASDVESPYRHATNSPNRSARHHSRQRSASKGTANHKSAGNGVAIPRPPPFKF
eukprot:TRINITY_DN20071_c0_g1_i1.p1 TRINITY_DN20071_c0_g1~~TRINITY_DN20071_c0_g1_i1.p1  ORF type:complete len:787 (+),score=127.09 TRINITY_DN20071_c0_g1_i1:79-2439(+)